jgi:ABC-type branched-subunit amino acid transport system substrate-binding protein
MAAEEPGARTITVKVYDTGGDPARAATVARQAVAEGAKLIVGPLFGANTPAVADAVRGTGINVLSFSSDSAVAGDPVYVTGYLPEMEARRILGYAARQGLTTIGVYAPQIPYGDAALRGAEEAASSTGAFIATRMTYPRSFQDIQATAGEFAQNANAAGVQAVLLPDYGDGLKIVGSFLDFNGLSPARVKFLGLGQWETRSTFGEQALRGGWFAGADPASVQAFADRYAARYGEVPQQAVVAALGYDAVRIAAALVADARVSGSREPFSDAALTRPQGFSGALGPVRFLPDGRAERGLAILSVGARSFEVLEPVPPSFGAGF